MVKELVHDPIILGIKATLADKADSMYAPFL